MQDHARCRTVGEGGAPIGEIEIAEAQFRRTLWLGEEAGLVVIENRDHLFADFGTGPQDMDRVTAMGAAGPSGDDEIGICPLMRGDVVQFDAVGRQTPRHALDAPDDERLMALRLALGAGHVLDPRDADMKILRPIQHRVRTVRGVVQDLRFGSGARRCEQA